MDMTAAGIVRNGEAFLGIELGSTRIKAVLIDAKCNVIAQGSYAWKNHFDGRYWSYHQDEIWCGLRSAYTDLRQRVEEEHGISIQRVAAMGISGMMHGYLAFDTAGDLLVPFRTWRNNTTGEAAEALTRAFSFNVPERWSVAHLYQALLSGEMHVAQVDYMTTLSGYIHWQLSGEKVLGIDDASGMFPIDPTTETYNARMLEIFSGLPAAAALHKKLDDILPCVLMAGRAAGKLTPEGAALLDESGTLMAGCPMCPPEGDAGTGMIATNSIRERTGNISVGTSIFSMNVLERPFQKVYRDVDIVMTPNGKPTAMVHSNNCTSDINAWFGLFSEIVTVVGQPVSADTLYQKLFQQVEQADPGGGGLLNYSFLSGENLTRTEKGRPLFVRTPQSSLTLANFVLTQLYAAFAPLRIGFDILTQEEGIRMERMIAHGGLFRTPHIAQQVLANMLDVPVAVMKTAAEGGAWGMAVLALYAFRGRGEDLADFLDREVFAATDGETLTPDVAGVRGAQEFIARYRAALPIEDAAGNALTYDG